MEPQREPDWPAAELRAVLGAPRLPQHARARHLRAVRLRAAQLPDLRPVRPTPRRRPWMRRRLVAVVGAAALLLGLSGGVAAASTDALPGDRLYGVKLGIERALVAASSTPERQVGLHLSRAARRLAEADALQAGARPGADVTALLDELLARHGGHVAAAAVVASDDAALQAQVLAAGQRAVERLGELLDGDLPEEASERALEALRDAWQRIQEVSPPGHTEQQPPAPAGDPPAGPRQAPEAQAPGPPAEAPGPPAGPPGRDRADDRSDAQQTPRRDQAPGQGRRPAS